ncbi:MAG: hypothetical protein ACOYLX_19555, partial [Burkholderiaceae bacterium]
MGIFDRSSSSVANITETTATDRRIVADGGSVVLGDGSGFSNTSNTNVFNQTTDLGAIQAAMQLGMASLGTVERTTDRSLDTADEAFAGVNRTLGRVLDQTATQQDRAASSLDKAATLVRDAFTTAQDSASGNRTLVQTG